ENIKDDALARTFPNHLFFSVIYRRYPIARLVRPPLKASNLYAVPGDGDKPLLLTETKELETFFRKELQPVKDESQAKDAARAWLDLSPVFMQDGFYQFRRIEEATKAARQDGGMKATGKVVVMKGGNGEIAATLLFNEDGKLTK